MRRVIVLFVLYLAPSSTYHMPRTSSCVLPPRPMGATSQRTPTGFPQMAADVILVRTLQGITVVLYSYLAFIFLPALQHGGSPFVPTAEEKLQMLFGTSGILLPGGGVLRHEDPPLAKQHLVDLGSGDGSVVRAASRLAGFGRASGYEINPGLVKFSALRSARRVNEQFHQRSLWDAPLSDADVVVVYILPKFLDELGAKLGRELRHDAVVVSNAYPFPEMPHLRLVLEVPVETPFWLRQDKSSSLWCYRVCKELEA